MFNLLLFSPLVVPIGLGIAIWGYPWRSPKVRPYLWFVLALAGPLLIMLGLQAAFTLPAGSCIDRPVNVAPFVLDFVAVAVAAILTWLFAGYRRFIVGASLVLVPLTLAWSLVVGMALSGCWI